MTRTTYATMLLVLSVGGCGLGVGTIAPGTYSGSPTCDFMIATPDLEDSGSTEIAVERTLSDSGLPVFSGREASVGELVSLDAGGFSIDVYIDEIARVQGGYELTGSGEVASFLGGDRLDVEFTERCYQSSADTTSVSCGMEWEIGVREGGSVGGGWGLCEGILHAR